MKSIMQNGKYCFISKENSKTLDKHHIFNGPCRDWSEKNGLWVYLTRSEHAKAHNNKDTALLLKRIGQFKYEETHSHEEFMNAVHKNYLSTPLSDEEKEEFNLIESDGYTIC